MIKSGMVVDPPEGWKYGFPKVFNPKEEQSYKDWLLEQGYPEKLIELALKHSRWWSWST